MTSRIHRIYRRAMKLECGWTCEIYFTLNVFDGCKICVLIQQKTSDPRQLDGNEKGQNIMKRLKNKTL